MAKLVRLTNSPFTPPVEVVDELVITLHVPYTEKNVTVRLNPNIQDYQEKDDRPGVKVRQVMQAIPTDQTQEIKFDFGKNKVKLALIENKKYQIELTQIGKENVQGHCFPFFEFLVSNVG